MITAESKEESSVVIRERVRKVWDIQKRRYANEAFSFNGRIPASEIGRFCVMDNEAEELSRDKFEETKMTARTFHSTLRVARTLADMEGAEKIERRHFLEAFAHRRPERGFWQCR